MTTLATRRDPDSDCYRSHARAGDHTDSLRHNPSADPSREPARLPRQRNGGPRDHHRRGAIHPCLEMRGLQHLRDRQRPIRRQPRSSPTRLQRGQGSNAVASRDLHERADHLRRELGLLAESGLRTTKTPAGRSQRGSRSSRAQRWVPSTPLCSPPLERSVIAQRSAAPARPRARDRARR